MLNITDKYLEDEIRDGFYIPSMTKRTWAMELTVLDLIDSICTKHSIKDGTGTIEKHIQEVKEARIREEWRTEYMQTIVHDKDVYRDGYDDGKAEGIAEGKAEEDIPNS